MPTLETLEIVFKAKKTEDAVKNIKDLAVAVSNLSNSLKTLDASKLSTFTSSMETLKNSVPTKGQTNRMVGFANAVTDLSNAIGTANITTFANDMSTMGQAVQMLKGKTVTGLTNAVTAVTQLGQQAQQTANIVQNATAKMPKADSMQGSTNTVNSVNDVVAALDKVSSRTDMIKQKFKGLIVPTKSFKRLEEEANRVAKKYDELRQKMQEALNNGESADSSAFKKQAADLEALRNKYDRLIQKQKELALSGGGVQFNPAVVGAVKEFGKGFTQVTNIVKNGFNAAMKAASSHIRSFVSHAKSAASSLKKTASSGFKASDMAKKLSKEILRLSKMLKLMITRMALRKVIEEVGNGFKSLALHCKTFDDNVSNVINSSKKLGYSFAGMVEPIINALAPALIYLIELITRVVNALNQLFTALGGGTVWHKAKDFTGSWSDSIKAANKNAKELKKTVLGFDELNQLTDKTTSGGDTSGNIVDMFEDVKIDPKWKEFADWLKEMWDIKDFTGLGTLVGSKIKDYLDSIPWEEIRKTSNDLGKCVATLINGLVEVEGLGQSIGRTLAQGVNTVFEFFNGFVHNLHWDSIGKFIADTFNGFFENIDWKLIKDTVVTGMKGIATAIQTFIDTFHWDNLSNFIINGVDTVVSGIRAFFEGIKWKDLGVKIGEQITKSIKGINWRDIGIAIGDIIQAAVSFVSGLVSQLKVEDIRAALKEMVDGFFDTVDTEELGQTLADIIDLVIQVAAGFWNDNKDRLWEEGKKLVSSIFDNLDDETKETIAKAVAAVVGAGVALGVARAGVSILADAVITGFKNKLVAALFGTTGAGATGAAGAATSGVAAEAGAIGAASSASFASSFLAGISAALIPVAVTAALGYAIAIPASKKLEEILSGTREKVEELKTNMDNTIPTYDEMSRAAREASRNQKEYAEKMQEMYDAVLDAHPELKELAKAMDDNGIKGSKNVDVLVQLNDGLKIFRDNGYSAKDTLEKLEEMYGKVDKKTQDFFYDLELGESKTTNVSAAMYDFNEKLKESETTENNLIKVYKNHNEVIEDMKKQHENVVGQFKTHWDVINQNKDATEKYTTAVNDAASAMPTLDSALQTSMTEMQKASSEAEKTGDNIVNGIKEPIINAKFDKESQSLFETVTNNIKKAFGIASPAKNMKPIGNDILLGVNEGFEDKESSFTTTITNFYNNKVKPWFEKNKWTFPDVGRGLQDTFEQAKNLVKAPINGILGFMEKLVNGIVDGFNKMADTLGDLNFDIPDWVPEVGGKHFELHIPKLNHVSLPKLKNGGMLEDGLFFMANHNELVGEFSNGKSAVANNEQILRSIEIGVYNATMRANANSNSGSGGVKYVAADFYIDGEKFASSLAKGEEKRDRRYNPSMA